MTIALLSDTVTLLGARVLVDLHDQPERTPGGIVIPDTAQPKKAQRGTVLGVGDTVTNVAVGDTVLIGRWGHIEVTLQGQPLYIYRVEDIMGVLHDRPCA